MGDRWTIRLKSGILAERTAHTEAQRKGKAWHV